MKSNQKPILKHSKATRRRMLSCVLIMVSLTVVSCQSTQPKLRTVKYDNQFRQIPIATAGRAEIHQLVRFFNETNPNIDINYLNSIARTYIYEAAAEGINSDIAFCQMVHETNYLRFGGDVRPWQNNFCGLGATGGGNRGLTFSSAKTGIRAHIQHLKAYANAQPLRNKLVDPRFNRVRRGRAPYVDDLTGKWATDPQYATKLKQKLQTLEKHL